MSIEEKAEAFANSDDPHLDWIQHEQGEATVRGTVEYAYLAGHAEAMRWMRYPDEIPNHDERVLLAVYGWPSAMEGTVSAPYYDHKNLSWSAGDFEWPVKEGDRWMRQPKCPLPSVAQSEAPEAL